MSKRNENRPGYKKTKVGWIPEEWNAEKLGMHVGIISGNSPAVYNPGNSGAYPFVKVDDMNLCSIYQSSARLYSSVNKSLVPEGAIIFAKRGAAIATNKVRIAACPLVMDSNMMALVAKDSMDYLFLYYSILKERLWKIADTSTVPQINNKHIKPYKIPLPPLPEQKKIAEILSTWDRAIEQVGKLIDAKQQLKKGLMQQLLTSRMRFPEFGKPVEKKGKLPVGWKACKLGDCFKERKETNPDLPLLAITSDRGVIPRDEVERKDTSNADKSKYKRIAPGDIGYNTMRMWQGVSAVSTLEGIVSPAYTICTPKKGHSPSFFGYLFKYPPMINLFHRFSQGLVSDTLNLKFRHFSQVKANVPSEAEQTRIATVLSTCDREIELLKKKQEKLKEQKKGLMQKLLTGEVRHPDFWEYSDIPGDSINDNQ